MNDYGLTADNLMSTLPMVLAEDEKTNSLARAVSEKIAEQNSDIDSVKIYAAVDSLSEELLDILAYDFKVDWWDYNASIEEKRLKLKSSWEVHKRMGTKSAVIEAMTAVYSDVDLKEWFEYNGSPYHFKVEINDDDAGLFRFEKVQQVLKALELFKSLRSRCDDVGFEEVKETKMYVGAAIHSGSILYAEMQSSVSDVAYVDENGVYLTDENEYLLIE